MCSINIPNSKAKYAIFGSYLGAIQIKMSNKLTA